MKVRLKIVSEKGHDEKLLLVNEALAEIKSQTHENGKWVYIDGQPINTEIITEEDIKNANDITLTNALAGG